MKNIRKCRRLALEASSRAPKGRGDPFNLLRLLRLRLAMTTHPIKSLVFALGLLFAAGFLFDVYGGVAPKGSQMRTKDIIVSPGTPVSRMPICGNGIRESGEECDDGNRIDGDTCTPECRWSCIEETNTTPLGDCPDTWTRTPTDVCLGGGNDVVVDPRNNVYAIGSDGAGIVVVKYDRCGNYRWSRTVRPAHPRSETGHGGIVTDSAGNVYITCGVEPPRGGFDSDILVRKYDTCGREKWSQNFSAGNDDHGTDIVLDKGERYVYAVGAVGGSRLYSFFVGNYSTADGRPAGSPWPIMSIADTPSVSEAIGRGVAIGPDENIYVLVENRNYEGTRSNKSLRVVKIKPYGYFERPFGTAVADIIIENAEVGNDVGGDGIAVDSSEQVYVIGTGTLEETPGLILERFGDERTSFDPFGYGSWGFRGNGVAIDNEHNVYIIGTYYSSSSAGSKIFVRKYNSAGEVLWSSEGPGVIGLGNGISIGPDGGILTTGRHLIASADGTRSCTFWIRKYRPDGTYR